MVKQNVDTTQQSEPLKRNTNDIQVEVSITGQPAAN